MKDIKQLDSDLFKYLHGGTYCDNRVPFSNWALEIVQKVAERSTCVRRQAGAMAVAVDNSILSIGYNGVPRGVKHCIERPCPGAKDPPGNTDNCLAVHAEVNCILNAGDVRRIYAIYCSASPCLKCACIMANLPDLKKVVYYEEYPDIRGLTLLRSVGIDTICAPLKKRRKE